MPDLLDGSHRTCLAWTTDAGPTIVPATARFAAWFDGTPGGIGVQVEVAEALPAAPREVVVLVDAGVWWFDLRAVYVRGTLREADAIDRGRQPDSAPASAVAAVVEPTKVTAWHYGLLREAGDAPR